MNKFLLVIAHLLIFSIPLSSEIVCPIADSGEYLKSDLTECLQTCDTSYFFIDPANSNTKTCIASCNNDFPYVANGVTNPFQCLATCSPAYFFKDLNNGGQKTCMTTECKDDSTLKKYFKLTSDTSGHYQCVEKCSTTAYTFTDTFTTAGKSYCIETCPNGHLYYVNNDDAMVCLANCKDDAGHSYQETSSGKTCVAGCTNHGYTFSSDPSDQKICLATECKDDPVLKNRFKLSSDSSDQYQCVQFCPSVAYKYQDSYCYAPHSHCVNECPNTVTYFMNDATQECRKRCPDNFQYYVKVDGSQQCLSKCPVDKPKVDNYTEIDKSYKCVAYCPTSPTNLYEDPLTFKGTTFCVLSCKALTPIAYIDKDGKTCTRECKTDGYIYIDFSDEMNPKCSAACPTKLKYIDAITNTNEKRCVSSCKNLIPSAFISKDGNSCTRKCSNNEFISSSVDNPQCKDECQDGEYKDALTDLNNPRCVSSCKLLVPSAYINKAGDACTLRCESTEVIDGITDENNPQCKANCKGLGADNSIEGYIAIQDYYNEDEGVIKEYKICVTECEPNEYDHIFSGIGYCDGNPYRHNNISVSKCPLSAPYLDLGTDKSHPACLSSCKSSAPYIFAEPNEVPKCVSQCPTSAPFVDMTQIQLTCIADCPEGTKLIISNKTSASVCYIQKFSGEYGDYKLCSEKTIGCAECHPITGVCQRCQEFFGILEGNICQCQADLSLYFDSNTNSFICAKEAPEAKIASFDINSICTYNFLKLKEFAYNSNEEFDPNITFQNLFNCDNYNFDQIGEILLGFLRLNRLNYYYFSKTLTTLTDLIYEEIQQSQDNINEIIFEVLGLIFKLHNETNWLNDVGYKKIIQIIDFTLENWQQHKYPIQSFPQTYHFLNYYIQIGLINQDNDFKSSLFKEKYQIQIDKEKIQSIIINEISYVHFVMEEIPTINLIGVTNNIHYLSYSQYFNIYPNEAKNLLIHCNKSVSIIFPNFVSAATTSLQGAQDECYLFKVLCENIEEDTNKYSICYPETLATQNYLALYENSELPLYSDCDPIDIKDCVTCRSEQQCETCLNNALSFSDTSDLQTYGKCNCPEGFFVSGFVNLACINSSNLEWASHNETIQNKANLDQEFYDKIFTVLQIDQQQVYSDYIEKFKLLLQTAFDSIESIDYTYIIKIMKKLKDKDQQILYQYLYDLIVMISNHWINTNECDLAMLEELFQLIFDCYPQITDSVLRINMYKASMINYIGQQYTKCFFVSPFCYNDHYLKIQTNTDTYQSENLTIRFSQNIDSQVQQQCLTQSGATSYYLQIHIMNKTSNPYNIYASYKILSEKLIDVYFICQTGMQQAQMNFDLSDYIYINFPQFEEVIIDDIQCIQYDSVTKSWKNETNGQNSNECYFNPSQNVMGISGLTNISECPDNCYTCKNSICEACKSNYYNIDNVCISRATLKLRDFLFDGTYIYILSLETGKYLGVNNNMEYVFYDNYSNEIAIEQYIWKAKIIDSNYEFINQYNQEIKFSYDTDSTFILNKMQDNKEYSFLYGNIAQLQPQSQSQCIDNTFQLVSCLFEENQLWEFLPVQTNLNQAIDFTAEFIADSDQIQIQFLEYKEDVVYVIAGEYNPNFNEIDTYVCSSANNESPIDFVIGNNKVTIVLSLKDLQSCGFIETTSNDLSTFQGQIIHLYPQSQQLFYNTLKVSFDPTIDFSIGNSLYEDGSIKVIELNQQGEDKEITTSFAATINSTDSDDQQTFQVNNSFTLEIKLAPEITGLYTMTVPPVGKLKNSSSDEIEVPLLLVSREDGKNSYTISVNLEGVSPGRYILSFSCIVKLDTRRILEQRSLESSIPEAANVFVQKEIVLQANTTNIEDLTIDDEVEETNNGMSNILLIFIIIGGIIVVVTVIIIATILLRRKFKNEGKMKSNEKKYEDYEKIQMTT